MRKLTDAQIAALVWLPDEGSRGWNGARFGSPSRAALNACLRRGWAVPVGHRSMDLYRRTPAGRAALAKLEERDA